MSSHYPEMQDYGVKRKKRRTVKRRGRSCEQDALSEELFQKDLITHVINVSKTGRRPTFLSENDGDHFLRIPIDDSLNEKLFPYFETTYRFIEKVRLSNGRVLIHCLAGISRSAAIAISYVMRYLHLSVDDAYHYVKQRRPKISPNLNFMGQLLEYGFSLSLTSKKVTNNNPTTSVCWIVDPPRNNLRHAVQLESSANRIGSLDCRNHNTLSRPTSFSLDLSNLTRQSKHSMLSFTITDESTESHPEHNLPHDELLSTYSNSSKFLVPTIEQETVNTLINSSYDELESMKMIEKRKPSLTASVQSNELINTFFQNPTLLSKSWPLWESPTSSNDSRYESTVRNNICNSISELSVA